MYSHTETMRINIQQKISKINIHTWEKFKLVGEIPYCTKGPVTSLGVNQVTMIVLGGIPKEK